MQIGICMGNLNGHTEYGPVNILDIKMMLIKNNRKITIQHKEKIVMCAKHEFDL